MIYLIDNSEHGSILKEIIDTDECVLIEIQHQMSIKDIIQQIHFLMDVVNPKDIVLCSWQVSKSVRLDSFFSQLSERCFVVVAAGNSSTEISLFSPTSATGVIVVGALNKAGNRAAFNNYSDVKECEWEFGTNVETSRGNVTGTSFAAAKYAAKLHRRINTKSL